MKTNRILIYGSSYLTELVIDRLKRTHDVIGYVPCKSKPTIPGGCINVPEYDGTTPYDISISVQYDRKLPVDGRTFNLHTGLLPEYGGRDILRHTLNENQTEQGLTFHLVDEGYDSGNIISKITYPIIEGDTEKSLYQKQCLIAPTFVLSCLHLLRTMKKSQLEQCHSYPPRLLERDGTGKDQDFFSWRLTNVWSDE